MSQEEYIKTVDLNIKLIIKNCFMFLANTSDKSIVIYHENYFGETVDVKPWNKFVNKYNDKGEKLTINSIN